MSWLYLFIAGIFEISWAVTLKEAATLNSLSTIFVMLISMGLSTFFLALAVRTLPIAIAYAVWTGIGILGTTLFSFLVSQNKIHFFDLLFIGLLLIGIAGLRLTHS